MLRGGALGRPPAVGFLPSLRRTREVCWRGAEAVVRDSATTSCGTQLVRQGGHQTLSNEETILQVDNDNIVP